jgi:hypothetical protein
VEACTVVGEGYCPEVSCAEGTTAPYDEDACTDQFCECDPTLLLWEQQVKKMIDPSVVAHFMVQFLRAAPQERLTIRPSVLAAHSATWPSARGAPRLRRTPRMQGQRIARLKGCFPGSEVELTPCSSTYCHCSDGGAYVATVNTRTVAIKIIDRFPICSISAAASRQGAGAVAGGAFPDATPPNCTSKDSVPVN